MKILITGSAGFIGFHLHDYLSKKKFKVYGCDNLSSISRKTQKLRLKEIKKRRLSLNNKVKFLNFIMPPFIAIISLILCSSTFIYFYNPVEDKEKNELINPE